MNIWMDLTNSLCTWKLGVVGIIRAELEFANNLKKIYPDIRFSVCNDNGFKEINNNELQWLWDAENVADAYLLKMGRYKSIAKDNCKDQNIDKYGLEDQEIPIPLSNAYAFSESRRERLREAGRISISNKNPIVRPIAKFGFNIVFKPIELGSHIRVRRKSNIEQKKLKRLTKNNLDNSVKHEKIFSHPYSDGDIIFSCGWYTSNKEACFSKVKSTNVNISLVYLIYDIIPIRKGTAQFYDNEVFRKYLFWVSNNCDGILYGGKTAQRDTEQYLRENNLHIPLGRPIKFGAEIVKSTIDRTKSEVLKKLGIDDKYIMAVGTFEPRKNYDTIYKAYLIMLEKYERDKIPQLLIIGGSYEDNNVLNSIKTNPLIKNKIIVLRPTDEELDVIYRNCQFAILPSLYEGWSLTLPEALGYGKLCLSSKVDPLVEIGKDFIDYVEPKNPMMWAEKINYYFTNENKVKEFEKKIKSNWKVITWKDSANMVLNELIAFGKNFNYISKRTIYYDLTLAWYSSFSNAFVSGILRTQLLLARYLNNFIPDIKYIAITHNGYINIDKYSIAPILENGNIDKAFKECRECLQKIQPVERSKKIEKASKEIKEKADAFWLYCSILPSGIQKKFIKLGRKIKSHKLHQDQSENVIEKRGVDLGKAPFRKNDIIFSTGTGTPEMSLKSLMNDKEKISFKFIQLIYDYTPILIPHTHLKETCEYYKTFLKNTSYLADIIFYGGATAMRDGEKYCINNNLPGKKGYPIKFGSNIVKSKINNVDDQKVLENIGITGDYTLTVGSIEMRKNHETLYNACIKMLEQSEYKVPQMVFAGYPGWKTEEFLKVLSKDEQIKNKIIVISPTDEEMDVLYRNCLFTILASMYEGWSLTLPESLNYGKFCICSDVEPLRETGQNFVDYVHPFNTNKWAEKILYYANNNDELKRKEEKIKNQWHAISWIECAENIVNILNAVI